MIAFVGKPHRMDDRGQQVVKALTDIGFDHYYQADLKGWVLYLEGSTDLAILRAFARILDHPAAQELERPFAHYLTTNLPSRAREHFFALQEARTDLVGFALFDRLEKPLQSGTPLTELMWQKRERLVPKEKLDAEVTAKLDARLRDKDMGIELTPAAKKLLSEKGYDPVLGARPLRRAIQRELEDVLSEKILFGELRPGQTVVIDSQGEGLLGEFLFTARGGAADSAADAPEPVAVSAMPPLTTTDES